jgi:high frequency lysogenization protein
MKDRTLALAGLLQAIQLVQQMANNGQADSRALEASIGSLFRFDAEDAAEVFGGPASLKLGLQRVIAQLEGDGRDTAQTRIAMSVLHLERRFMASADAAGAVHAELEALQAQALADGAAHPEVLARLGELYAARIAPLGARVLVQGNPVYLSQPSVVGEVRATLLAALRAAVMWRQLGGSWWDLLLSRRRLVDAAQALLESR